MSAPTIFSEGDYMSGTLTWGWQHFACRGEETGWPTASTAREAADQHADWCTAEPTNPVPQPTTEDA